MGLAALHAVSPGHGKRCGSVIWSARAGIGRTGFLGSDCYYHAHGRRVCRWARSTLFSPAYIVPDQLSVAGIYFGRAGRHIGFGFSWNVFARHVPGTSSLISHEARGHPPLQLSPAYASGGATAQRIKPRRHTHNSNGQTPNLCQMFARVPLVLLSGVANSCECACPLLCACAGAA